MWDGRDGQCCVHGCTERAEYCKEHGSRSVRVAHEIRGRNRERARIVAGLRAYCSDRPDTKCYADRMADDIENELPIGTS